MTTILSEFKLNGISLMDGKQTEALVKPSRKEGIWFYPNNCTEGIRACLDNVVSTLHCTVLGNGKNIVKVVEHFMAACAFAGIDSIEIYLNSEELPILDGSALKWHEAFKKAGITNKIEKSEPEITTPQYLISSATVLSIIPDDSCKVTYCVDFKHPDLRQSWYEWDLSKGIDEIVEARTFGYVKDLEKFQQAGFALGVQIDNTIGLTEEGYTIDLRSDKEPIKHKILDLIGDMYLTGINLLHLKANIIAKNAGHKSHIEFAKVVKNALEREKCLQTK
jgi:UDP-3-O-acyl N-acetylglucosamine deacetylase